MLRAFFRHSFLCCLLLSLISGVSAQEAYPSKPIRMVVSFGGGAGELARLLANKMGESLGQQVWVDVQPAAAGIIGAGQVSRAHPDGYTILTGSSNSMIFRPLTMKRPPYDPVSGFTPVSQFTAPALALAVHPKLGVNTFQEFVEYTKRQAAPVNVGVFGSPSIAALTVSSLRSAVSGLKLDSVPYKDEGQAVSDTLGGQVPAVIVTTSSLLGAVRQGNLKALAVFAEESRPGFERVPAINELVPGFESLRPFTGVWGPAGMPRPLVDRLNAAIVSALSDPAIRERIVGMGSLVKPSTPEELHRNLNNEIRVMSKALKQAGVEPE